MINNGEKMELKDKLWENVNMLQSGLKERGFDIGSTQSCVTPVYLEGSVPEAMALVRDLRENLNKKEEANAKLQYLKYTKLRQQMFMLNMTTNPDKFLDDLDALKKQKGINNLWKEEQYKEWREDIKKHPEKIIRMT